MAQGTHTQVRSAPRGLVFLLPCLWALSQVGEARPSVSLHILSLDSQAKLRGRCCQTPPTRQETGAGVRSSLPRTTQLKSGQATFLVKAHHLDVLNNSGSKNSYSWVSREGKNTTGHHFLSTWQVPGIFTCGSHSIITVIVRLAAIPISQGVKSRPKATQLMSGRGEI